MHRPDWCRLRRPEPTYFPAMPPLHSALKDERLARFGRSLRPATRRRPSLTAASPWILSFGYSQHRHQRSRVGIVRAVLVGSNQVDRIKSSCLLRSSGTLRPGTERCWQTPPTSRVPHPGISSPSTPATNSQCLAFSHPSGLSENPDNHGWTGIAGGPGIRRATTMPDSAVRAATTATAAGMP